MTVQLVKVGTWAEVNPNGTLLANNVEADFVTTLTGDGTTREREWAVMARTRENENLTAVDGALRRALELNRGSFEGVIVRFYRREECADAIKIMRMVSEVSPDHSACFYDEVLVRPSNIKLDQAKYFEAIRAELEARRGQQIFEWFNPLYETGGSEKE